MRALVLFVLLLTGCHSEPPRAPSLPAVQLYGDGLAALTDGQDAALISGAQGGFHVWMDFRLPALDAQPAEIVRTAYRASDDQIVLRFRGAMQEAGPLPMFMCPSPIGLSVVDQPILFQLEFRDGAGQALARGAITLVPRCPAEPGDQRDFCLRICTG